IISGVFVLGGALAGIAGVIGAGLLSLRPGADVDILLFALVVVIIGGLGSINGAAVGRVLIGVIDATSRVWLPESASSTIVAAMALVLVRRPTVRFGRKVGPAHARGEQGASSSWGWWWRSPPVGRCPMCTPTTRARCRRCSWSRRCRAPASTPW